MNNENELSDKKNKNTIINIENLTVTLKNRIILNNVTLSIDKGIFLPVIGPNGSGKSTFFKVILRLITPTKGKISIKSENSIGYVSQEKPIKDFFPVSVMEIVGMGFFEKSSFFRDFQREDINKIEDALMFFGLTDYKDYYFNELSGGLKKKTLLARSYVSNADIFILDEPFSELDSGSSGELLSLLLELNKIHEKTIIFSYHSNDDYSSFLKNQSPYCLVKDGAVKIIDKNLSESVFYGQ